MVLRDLRYELFLLIQIFTYTPLQFRERKNALDSTWRAYKMTFCCKRNFSTVQLVDWQKINCQIIFMQKHLMVPACIFYLRFELFTAFINVSYLFWVVCNCVCISHFHTCSQTKLFICWEINSRLIYYENNH